MTLDGHYRAEESRQLWLYNARAITLVFLGLSLIAAAFYVGEARALPAGGQVSAGAATIQQAPGQPSLTVNQSSQNAAINWQSFSIGANEAVQFNQPNANSITLNRVTGQDPSQILGKLTANGQIFLLNPNGILFGQGAQVNVGGIVASTLGMSDADFMAGNYVFTNNGQANGGSAGSVVNEGTITVTPGGTVALIGPIVTNSGKIKAPDGSVALTAGDRVTLTFADGGLTGLNVDIGTLNALVANKGAIIAGKQVILTAKAMDQLTKSVVNNTGLIEAKGITERNGVITLAGDNITNSGKLTANKISVTASNDVTLTDSNNIIAHGAGATVAITGGATGAANIGGTIDAAAKRANEAGGQVFITAGMVAIDSSTLIDVSGPAGGGTIDIGGGLHGGGALAHAMAVTIASRATMNADATESGDGGVIAIWSDGTSQVSGVLSAKGGAQGGNGGTIETSGHVLDTTGISIDASAALGTAGTWLLDPYNLQVVSTASGTLASNTGYTYSPNGANSYVLASTIDTALNGGNNVTLQTSSGAGGSLGDIVVNAAISKTTGGAATLTMNAYGSVYVGSSIIASGTSGALTVVMDADTSNSAAGGYATVAAQITTLGGALTIGGQGTPLTLPAVGTAC
jgi:filamentous hemagglutinin family protein